MSGNLEVNSVTQALGVHETQYSKGFQKIHSGPSGPQERSIWALFSFRTSQCAGVQKGQVYPKSQGRSSDRCSNDRLKYNADAGFRERFLSRPVRRSVPRGRFFREESRFFPCNLTNKYFKSIQMNPNPRVGVSGRYPPIYIYLPSKVCDDAFRAFFNHLKILKNACEWKPFDSFHARKEWSF